MKKIVVTLTVTLTPAEYECVKDFEIKALDAAGHEIAGYWVLKDDVDKEAV